jgi:arylsulfatase A-like enzyme
MVSRVGNEVGKLMLLLPTLIIFVCTLVFFVSDNGNTNGNVTTGENSTKAFFKHESPRAGQKGDILDGAFHVPAIARWPDQIEPRQTSDHIWAMWDFMPTIADILDTDIPRKTDGLSILPTLLGNVEKQAKHDFLYWEYKQEQAVRMEDWYGYKNKDGVLEIYNLKENPEQDKDLSEQYPDIAERMNEIMNNEHTPSDVWPSPGESKEEFEQRMAAMGIGDRPENVAEF